MKRIAIIFLLLCFCGIKHIQAKSEPLFSAEQVSTFSKLSNGFTQDISAINLSSIDSGDSGDSPTSKKRKRRKKAVVPVVIPAPSESLLIIVTFEIELVCSPRIFYCFRPDFAHGERGPPSPFLVS